MFLFIEYFLLDLLCLFFLVDDLLLKSLEPGLQILVFGLSIADDTVFLFELALLVCVFLGLDEFNELLSLI